MLSPVEEYVGLAKALKDVEAAMKKGRRVESVPARLSYGRIASRDLKAADDVPPAPVSHMDGFAISHSSFDGGRREFRLKGEVQLGAIPRFSIDGSEAARVATGSFLPRGADTVVPVERTRADGVKVRMEGSVEPGQFVFGRGEDLKRGSAIIRRGSRIRAQDVALLVSLGVESVEAYARPKVGVLATGDELSDSPRPAKGKVRNSHSPLFIRLLEEMGCQAVDFGIAADELGALVAKLKAGLRNTDMLLTTGGTSVGRLDIVGNAVERLAPSVSHHGLKIDRGRVTGVAVVGGRTLVMMPGPVQGAMNAFLLVAAPLVRAISGGNGAALSVKARLSAGWEARKRFPNFTKVAYVSLEQRDGDWWAKPLVADTESMTLLTSSDGFVIVPEEVTALAPGALVEVVLLPGYSWSS